MYKMIWYYTVLYYIFFYTKCCVNWYYLRLCQITLQYLLFWYMRSYTMIFICTYIMFKVVSWKWCFVSVNCVICDFINLCFYIFIFYFRTTKPIIATVSKNHNEVKGICSNHDPEGKVWNHDGEVYEYIEIF